MLAIVLYKLVTVSNEYQTITVKPNVELTAPVDVEFESTRSSASGPILLHGLNVVNSTFAATPRL